METFKIKKMNKISYHQSRLRNHFACHHKFKLSMEIQPKIKPATQKLLDEGNLFEGYVFGFKDDKNEDELYGGKREATIKKLKTQLTIQADYIRPLFVQPENSYIKIKHEADDYILAGEIDHKGQLDWDYLIEYTGEKTGKLGETINDLKKTGSISYVWNYMNKKRDFLQAIMYVYINFKNTGEILPFVYIIVEDTYNKPIIKIKKIFIQETDFEWLENFVDKVHNDLFYQPFAAFESCEGGKGGSRCWFLEYCQAGRSYIGQQEIVEFGLLN